MDYLGYASTEGLRAGLVRSWFHIRAFYTLLWLVRFLYYIVRYDL